jgi:hypothetical protein
LQLHRFMPVQGGSTSNWKGQCKNDDNAVSDVRWKELCQHLAMWALKTMKMVGKYSIHKGTISQTLNKQPFSIQRSIVSISGWEFSKMLTICESICFNSQSNKSMVTCWPEWMKSKGNKMKQAYVKTLKEDVKAHTKKSKNCNV